MNEVPTTQTSADRNAEKKRHADEMAALNSKKEIAERETKLAVEAADKAVARLKDVTETLDEMARTVETASRETREFMAHCSKILAESREKVTEMIDLAALVEGRAMQAVDILTKAKAEYAAVHDAQVEESRLMDIKREDLDIYHSRLKAYFDKYLPDQPIIV